MYVKICTVMTDERFIFTQIFTYQHWTVNRFNARQMSFADNNSKNVGIRVFDKKTKLPKFVDSFVKSNQEIKKKEILQITESLLPD
ncbi:hypothetical protein K0M31_003280 [Melipona bicolor]|uniref:Uncharacterized protein n=1 Tax=Melipona bicolor TaxID=60889 RepID=A0AA40KPB4_9HYME|nr:hypothetical protein K0M31_003280 [Melipona bicolor]